MDAAERPGDVISVSEACRFLGVHRNKLYRLIREEQLPAFKMTRGGRWRFRRDLATGSRTSRGEAAMRRPTIVSIGNHKGGCPKTTMTANLGAALARAGKRVLLDLDAQQNSPRA
jgi:excisionase family DNA binding protein